MPHHLRKRQRCAPGSSVFLAEGQGDSSHLFNARGRGRQGDGCTDASKAGGPAGSLSLEQLPAGVLEVVAGKLGAVDRASLRQACRQLRSSANAVTRVVRLLYRDESLMPWEVLEKLTGCKVELPDSQLLQRRRRERRGELGWRTQAAAVAAAFPRACSLVVECEEATGPLQEPPCFEVDALETLSGLRLTRLRLSPYLGPEAFPCLLRVGANLQLLSLEAVCLPPPLQLEAVLSAMPALRVLRLAASRRRTVDHDDIHLLADHLSALSRRAAPLRELHLQGFKLHGDAARWRDALRQLPAALTALHKLSLVDKPRHLTPTPQLSSCDVLGPLAHLPCLTHLRLHMGYCSPCIPERRCAACLDGRGLLSMLQRHGGQAAAAPAPLPWLLAPPSAGQEEPAASAEAPPAGLPPLLWRRQQPPAGALAPCALHGECGVLGGGSSGSGSSTPFPCLRHAELQNGYQFNNWVPPAATWLRAAPCLATVLVSTHVVDEQLSGLSELGSAEVHLHWQLPYSLQRLAPLASMANLTALTLGTSYEAPLLRGMEAVAGLGHLTCLEVLGGAAWDDELPPEHFMKRLPNLAVCTMPPYLSERVSSPSALLPLLDLALTGAREGRGVGVAAGAQRLPPNPAFAITLQRVASWSCVNREALQRAGATGVLMEVVEHELRAKPARFSSTLAHCLGALAHLSVLPAVCEALLGHLPSLLELLRRCCYKQFTPHNGAVASHWLQLAGGGEDSADACKYRCLQLLLHVSSSAPAWAQRVARQQGEQGSRQLWGMDVVIQVISRRGSEECKALAAQLLAVFGGACLQLRAAIIERGGIAALWAAAECMLQDKHRQSLEQALCALNVYEVM